MTLSEEDRLGGAGQVKQMGWGSVRLHFRIRVREFLPNKLLGIACHRRLRSEMEHGTRGNVFWTSHRI